MLTLRMAPRWRLPRQQWDDLAGLLSLLEAALDAGDSTTFGRAVDDLIVLAPTRNVSNVDGPVVAPPPEKIRERLNTLVHTLSEPLLEVATEPARQPDLPGQR